MADLSLVWFTIEERELLADREQLRQLATELGFAEVDARDSKVAAFVKAGKTTYQYVDAAGVARTLSARESKRTLEFITYQVLTETGSKLAEWKFFQSRRNRFGIVSGTHMVRSMIRRGLEGIELAAVTAWLAKAEAVYEQRQKETPMASVRRQIRVGLLEVAVPIMGREGFWFVYDDEMDTVLNVKRYLETALGAHQFAIVAVDDFADKQVFADSADVYLVKQVENVVTRLAAGLEPGKNRISQRRRDLWENSVRKLRVVHARHERRLSLPLPRSGSALIQADQLVAALPTRPASRV